ncbi:uncharacterized protein BKA55DRAFT_510806 [Fusarium redolens]|uniref:Uncharacterized protein n=1 Tax=Fusarium redolens TaxID=48865 RepID=A0A9P9H9I3_FUSRE|nr:uncharacterized protein BKA55DRAFT_510806 [Fusarium redolens]KAH7253639.1 hypothetical protein BKA55DRAFT_510806 [Fusarium redolens]
MLDKMNTALHQSFQPRTFEWLADNSTQLTTFDCFYYIRPVQKEIITILAIFGSASFLGWALSASFFFHTYCLRRRFNVVLHGRVEQDLLTAMMRMHEEFPDRNFKILVADPTVLGSADFWYRKSYGDWKLERKLDLDAIKTELSKLNLTSILENINVDALYPIQLFRTLLPTLIGNSPSLLMNITSLIDKGLPLKIATSASRSFLSRMTESSALEMKLEGYDVEALCVRVSRNMGQTDSNLAKAVIARVGSRRSVVVAHWYQFLYKGLVDLLPGWLWDWCIIHYIRGKRDLELKGS